MQEKGEERIYSIIHHIAEACKRSIYFFDAGAGLVSASYFFDRRPRGHGGEHGKDLYDAITFSMGRPCRHRLSNAAQVHAIRFCHHR